MTSRSYERLACPIAQSLSVLGEQWTLLILRDVLFGYSRFEEFQSSLGISRNLLSRRLAEMVESCLLERRPLHEGAKRHEYVATDKARGLLPVLLALGQWTERWEPSPVGPRVTPRDPESGEPVTVRLMPRGADRGVRPKDVLITPGPGADAAFRDRLNRKLAAED